MNVKIDILLLANLEPTEGNPQEMTVAEFEGLKKSIKEKGFILDDPVVWEYDARKYRIISGHHRIKAALDIGYDKLSCKIISGVNEKQARLLVLEANKRRGNFNGVQFERFVQDILVDYKEIDLDEINNEIGVILEEAKGEILDLQKESESLKLTINFESFEEKEKFVDILDYYGGRGRSIKDKVKNFVGIILRDQKKREEKEEEKETGKIE